METGSDRSATARKRVAELVKAARPRDDEYYRLWFDYLRLAHESSDDSVREDLQFSFRSGAYRDWTDVRNKRFEDWLEESKWALAQPCTRVLDKGELAEAGEITIAIRLDRGFEEIEKELVAQLAYRYSHLLRFKHYRPIPGDKVQLDALRDYWIFYQVHPLGDAEAKAKKSIVSARFEYMRSVKKRYSEYRITFPTAKAKHFSSDPTKFRFEVVRAQGYAKKIIENVARGVFPGPYNPQTKISAFEKAKRLANKHDEFARRYRRLRYYGKGILETVDSSDL